MEYSSTEMEAACLYPYTSAIQGLSEASSYWLSSREQVLHTALQNDQVETVETWIALLQKIPTSSRAEVIKKALPSLSLALKSNDMAVIQRWGKFLSLISDEDLLIELLTEKNYDGQSTLHLALCNGDAKFIDAYANLLTSQLHYSQL